MIIGVDAGAIAITDKRLKVGVYHITRRLLEELSRIDTKNSYRLYSFSPIGEGIVKSLKPSFQTVILTPPTGYMKIRLPLELSVRPVDVFLGLSQALPLPLTSHNLPPFWRRLRNRRKTAGVQVTDNRRKTTRCIGFIYDLSFLRFPEAYPDSYKTLKSQTDTLVGRADHVITISETSKRDIVRVYGKDKPITVCHLGVDARFTPRGERHQPDHPYFLFVGALKRLKNIPAILKGFAKFLEKNKKPYDVLFIGGDFWLDPEIPETIRTLKLSRRIRLLGAIPNDELPSYYRGAVALVTPSLWEGFCLPAVEAMASGCPVIASETGVFPEVVGEAGILVDPTDGTAIADAMTSMAGDSARRNDLSAKGLKRAEKYTWQSFAHGVYDVIKDVSR
jgi:glycosyltransferase involved in cell wall biosynthesis